MSFITAPEKGSIIYPPLHVSSEQDWLYEKKKKKPGIQASIVSQQQGSTVNQMYVV